MAFPMLFTTVAQKSNQGIARQIGCYYLPVSFLLLFWYDELAEPWTSKKVKKVSLLQ
jgi:hypothetical protein